MELFEINLDIIIIDTVKMLVALVLPLLIAWDRETEPDCRTAGLRTFPLVSMAACGFTILATGSFEDPQGQSKITEGIISGIGFICGGAILKVDSQVNGIATAAAIWATGAIGIAVGMGRIEIALGISIMTFLIFRIIGAFKTEND